MANIRLKEIAPELVNELRTLLTSEGYVELANQVVEFTLEERCRCDDDFCATFYTAPRKVPYGPNHSTIALAPNHGMINVDVVDGLIVCVEVLYRDEVRARIHSALP